MSRTPWRCAVALVAVFFAGAAVARDDAKPQPAPRARPGRPVPRINPRPAPGANPRPAAPAATASIVPLADFNAGRANDFPRDANLARGGTATASSTHPEMDEPFTALGGGRKHDTWSLDGPSGWFEATWQPPLTARHLLVFNRPGGGRSDPWDVGSVEINGQLAATINAFRRGHVLIVDLAKPTEIRTVKIWIQGEANPGLSGLEIHPGAAH